MFPRGFAVIFTAAALAFSAAKAQLPTSAASTAIRVTVSQNADGTRTSYETNPAEKRATATTTDHRGKVIGVIRYTLDDAGRYATGEAFGPGDKFLFRSAYKYDGIGRVAEETRMNQENVLQMKLVFAYDSNGKQAGYSVYDPAGKKIGETSRKR